MHAAPAESLNTSIDPLNTSVGTAPAAAQRRKELYTLPSTHATLLYHNLLLLGLHPQHMLWKFKIQLNEHVLDTCNQKVIQVSTSAMLMLCGCVDACAWAMDTHWTVNDTVVLCSLDSSVLPVGEDQILPPIHRAQRHS